MRYRITHTTKYAYSEPVPICQNKVHLKPRDTAGQTCRQFRLIIMPDPEVVESQDDFFGNAVSYFSLTDSHRGLSVTSTSEVEVDSARPQVDLSKSPPWEAVAASLQLRPPQVDINTCLYRFDSDYAAASVDLAEFARQSFTGGRAIGEATMDLATRVYQQFEYKPGVTKVNTPVAEVLAKKAGVCQDFAHLQIACLRSLGLAARYVSGYLRTDPVPGKPRLVGADESHAWLSVYCGELGWIDFDPTNNVIPGSDHVTVAYGRDYGDVCPIQGVYVGGGETSMTVSVDVAPLSA